jgi:hypothetical protein
MTTGKELQSEEIWEDVTVKNVPLPRAYWVRKNFAS